MVIAAAIIRLRSLIAVVMLAGIFSQLMAAIFLILDAVDVAFTESAVGAGVSTVLALGSLALTTRREKIPHKIQLLPIGVVLITGAAVLYGIWDAPFFGDPSAPVHHHVAPRYIEQGPTETKVPNIVTAVLASYRGYDTLGEVTVIFTAGIAVMLLLGGRRRSPKAGDDA
ncbi:MAG: DUF4040 domain-containing protein [Proteobacteria bacterium]|nr:DUF4040 domain-containing protein [Pseudomonadota bacterium]